MADGKTWLRPFQPNPHASLRLFCFPHAGAGVLSFRDWADLFPPDVEVCPVQLPGREDRFGETPYTRVRPLVETLARALYPHELATRFALLGHSMGAIIAFELAHLLQERYGVAPTRLFLSARIAPQLVGSRSPICSLPDEQFIEQLRMSNSVPEDLLAESAWVRLLRADIELNEAYRFRPRPRLPVSISAMAGKGDPHVSPSEMEQWSEQTSGDFKLRLFDGDHFYLYTARAEVAKSVLLDLSGSLY